MTKGARSAGVGSLGATAVLVTTISALFGHAAAADPARAARKRTAPAPNAIVAEPGDAADAADGDAPRACREPACKDEQGAVKSTGDDAFVPVNVHVHLGDVAVAGMEGLWLRRGPTLRGEPVMVSPIVVGDAVTLSLGGRF